MNIFDLLRGQAAPQMQPQPTMGAFPDLASDPAGALTKMYQDRLGELGKRVGERRGMSRDEIADLLVQSGLGMVEAGGKRGATFAGSVGTGLAKGAGEVSDQREKDKDEYEALMERAAQFGIGMDDRKYRRGRDAASDKRADKLFDYRAGRDQIMDTRHEEGIARDERHRAEDRDLALQTAAAKYDRTLTKEQRDRVHDVAKEVLDASKTDYEASPLTYQEAYDQAVKIVTEQYGGGALDSMRDATKELQRTLQEIKGQ